MNEDQNKEIHFRNDVAKHTVRVETPSPPPPADFTSPFATIKEWLDHICDTNHLEGTISEFHFSLSESKARRLLDLQGFNSYDIDNENTVRRIDFKPVTNMYFVLPEKDFGSLSQQATRERVLKEILSFIDSDKFKNSFLSKGDSIRISYAGKIWPR